MGEFKEFYQRALYYDIVFERDVTREVDFITAAYRHYAGGELRSMLELGCGPGYHAREFARRGVHAVGLDLKPEMLALAKQKADTEGLQVAWVEADMRDFTLPSRVDVAISMFDTHDAMLTNADLIRHFRAVGRNLTPRGLFILVTSHPHELNLDRYPLYRYVGERDGVKVELLYGADNPQFDPLTEVALVPVVLYIDDHGQKSVIRDEAYERLITPQEIYLLTELAGGLCVAGWHGDYDLAQPLDNSPASHDIIAVIQKAE